MRFYSFNLFNRGLKDTDLSEAITKFQLLGKEYHLWTVVISIRDCEINLVPVWEITINAKNRFVGIDRLVEFISDFSSFLHQELDSRKLEV